MTILWLIVIAAVSYLIGSISCAIIIVKAMGGDDIRSHGSGNAGATNALRTYGKLAALLVTLGDRLKSAICCIVAILLAKYTPLGAENRDLALYAAGFGSVLGHNFPLYFNFKGGKGILVSVTAYFFANWQIQMGLTDYVDGYNVGIGGTTTKDWLYAYDKLVKPFNADRFIISVGENDVCVWGSDGDEVVARLK